MTNGATEEVPMAHRRDDDQTSKLATTTFRPGATSRRPEPTPPQIQRLVNRLPHLTHDLVDASREMLFVEAVEARNVAEGATGTLERALAEVDRLERILGIGIDLPAVVELPPDRDGP